MRNENPGPLPAYEIKFFVDELRAQEALAWARGELSPDPNGADGTYTTATLYCDTPEWAIYRGEPAYFRRRKFRIRRYNEDPSVFLERKTKRGDRVAKRRAAIPIDELPLLAADATVPDGWAGAEFLRQLRQHRLGPAGLVLYRRTAFEGWTPDGPLRLTIDREVAGLPCRGWTLQASSGIAKPLLEGTAILEFKFRGTMPSPCKGLMRDLRLAPHSVSKYRLCWQAWEATITHA